jgi:hypothetical protein
LGEVVEWLKAPASKAGERDERSVSSNLTLSAMFREIRHNGSLVFLVAAIVIPAPSASSGIDAPAYYRAVLAKMRELREPAFLTYRTTVPGGDGSLVVSRDENGYAELAVVAGSASPQTWNVAYRTSDGVASVELSNGTRVLSSLAIFDPTWRGAYVWLHRGLNASIAAPEPRASSPEPKVSAPPVVAVVTAINETAYDVSDGGAAHCPGGSAARRLWMRAKSDPLRHPLTEALVDDASLLFCAMRFRQHLVSQTVTFDLDVNLHFAAVGAYYLAQGGTIDGVVRPYRRPGWFHIATAFAYDAFAFPPRLPDRTFTATPTVP